MIASTTDLRILRVRALYMVAAERADDYPQFEAQYLAGHIEDFTEAELIEECRLVRAEYPTHRPDVLTARARVLAATLAAEVPHA